MDSLDRTQDYRLWFDGEAFRWEVQEHPQWGPGRKPEAPADHSEAWEPAPGYAREPTTVVRGVTVEGPTLEPGR